MESLFPWEPRYREPKSTNFNKDFAEITTALDNCTEKAKYNVNSIDQWKKMILEKINLKIEKLKAKIKPSFTKPVLSDPDVLAYLATLHWNYVIVLIDKASNNFVFICKKFYISKILSEVGEYNNIQTSTTYSKTNCSKDDTIENNENYYQKSHLRLTDKDCSLHMYWLPKLHKASVGARLIIVSKNCCIKPLSSVISKIFKILFKHIENFIIKVHLIQVTKNSGL